MSDSGRITFDNERQAIGLWEDVFNAYKSRAFPASIIGFKTFLVVDRIDPNIVQQKALTVQRRVSNILESDLYRLTGKLRKVYFFIDPAICLTVITPAIGTAGGIFTRTRWRRNDFPRFAIGGGFQIGIVIICLEVMPHGEGHADRTADIRKVELAGQ